MELREQITEVLYNHEKRSITFILSNGSKFGYIGKRAIEIYKKLNN